MNVREIDGNGATNKDYFVPPEHSNLAEHDRNFFSRRSFNHDRDAVHP